MCITTNLHSLLSLAPLALVFDPTGHDLQKVCPAVS